MIVCLLLALSVTISKSQLINCLTLWTQFEGTQCDLSLSYFIASEIFFFFGFDHYLCIPSLSPLYLIINLAKPSNIIWTFVSA